MTDTDFAGPDTDAYRAAVAVYNLASPASPHSALTAHDVDSVRRGVLAATAAKTHLVPITTGHAAGMLTKDTEVRLIRTALHEPIEVEPDAGTVTFPAGALWSDVAAAAERHGLVVPHGSSGTVGVVGYLLGGGTSFYGRLLGTAANHLVSLRIVTADGQERTVSTEHNPDLFWALRGGGGFGVVTGGTIRAFPAPQIFTGMTVWGLAEMERVLNRWREWSQHAPHEISTSLRVLHLPPTPGLPPEMTRAPIVVRRCRAATGWGPRPCALDH